MKNDRFLKLIIIALLLVNAGTLAFLWMRREHRPHPGGRPGDLLAHQLQLTPEQMQIFDSLRDAHHAGVMERQRRIHDLQERLFDSFPAAAIPNTAVLNSIAAEQVSIDSLTYDHFIKMRSMLHPEQQLKFDRTFKDLLEQISRPHPEGGPPRPE